jgi:hypothetical protein
LLAIKADMALGTGDRILENIENQPSSYFAEVLSNHLKKRRAREEMESIIWEA